MRKVKLVLEHLQVESFDTGVAYGRGTVLGRDYQDADIAPIYGPASYPECPSPLCVDTPLASCDGSCQRGCVAPDTGGSV